MDDDLRLEMSDQPLRDVVFRALRQAILKGKLLPGERLMEMQLAKKLGVSRTPIREAMRMLELEGLVKMVPRKGAEVAGITEKNLRDVLEVRRALEELAIELACVRMNDEDKKELIRLDKVFQEAVKQQEAIQIAKADESFHEIIYRGTRNNKLIQLIENFREQMYRYRFEYIKDAGSRKLLLTEHGNITSAVVAGDIARAKKVIREHIDNQEMSIVRNLVAEVK